MADIQSILIFDDEPDFRKLTHSILKTKFDSDILHEYDPLVSGAPDENFDWSQHDVLLLDHHLRLENTTGLDILHQNKDNPDFPVTIMLTASNDEEIAFKALKLGISDFIRKQELTKKILFASINEAIVAKKKKLKQQENLKNIQQIFNKKYFYKTLNQDIETIDNVQKRIIIGFRIYEKNKEQPINDFAKDRITRHIAKESCRYFMSNNFQPYITLFSGSMVAVLLDVDNVSFDEKELIKNLHEYHLETPYNDTETNVEYNFVSCGLSLTEKTVSKQNLIKYFHIACNKAANIELESKRIYITNIQQLQTPVEKESDSEQILSQNDFDKEIEAADPKNESEANNEIYDIELNIDKLDENATLLVSSINDNSMIKTFQPIIMLSGREDSFLAEHDLYYLSSLLMDKEDKEINSNDLLENIHEDDVIKYYDRWLLKETISNIMDIKTGVEPSYFLLKLNQQTLDDPTFFNWLRTLLSDYEEQAPGNNIILDISHSIVKDNKKQIIALINYLHSSHGFNFAISDINELSELSEIMTKIDIRMVIINHDKLSELKLVETVDDKSENFISYLRRTNRYVVVTDINDSISLTTAIANGTDLAMGEFVGAAKASFEEEDAIQSVEIESDEFVSSRL